LAGAGKASGQGETILAVGPIWMYYLANEQFDSKHLSSKL
jgi:hypothetical protein